MGASMLTTNDDSSLAGIIKNDILPLVNHEGMANVFVAVQQWTPYLTLPYGMTATRKPITGKRIAMRTKHNYGKFFTEEAVWPKDNLQSMRVPRLFYILRYPLDIQISDYVLHCQLGHCVIVPPGTPSTHLFENWSSNWEMLRMQPYHEGLLCWHAQGWRNEKDKFLMREQSCSIPHSRASSYLRDLVEEAGPRREHHEVVCDGLIKILFSLLHRELQHLPVLKTGVPFNARSEQRPHATHPIRTAQEYIERNLREPLSIDDVARHVGMSRTIFTNQFRTRTGKTFVQYLQDLRFHAACELLRGGDMAIRQVAAAVGLKNDRMRVIFQEREGMAPSKYRQRHRQADFKK